MEVLKNAWPMVWRFALVYLFGTSLAIIVPILLGFRVPPTGLRYGLVFAVAAFAGWWAFASRHGRHPRAMEWVMAFLGGLMVLALEQVLSQMSSERSHALRQVMTPLAASAFALPYFLRRFGNSAAAAPAMRPRTVSADAVPPVRAALPKIPLSIGFANLASDPASEARRQTDIRLLGPLFQQVVAPPPGQVPGTPVLLVYARLQPDGTIAGMPQRAGIRQVVQATKAEVVVVATDNDTEAVQAAILLPGPKTAHIVFTLARRGELLPKFLAALFADMARGTDMGTAYVKICPQGPGSAREDVPATILAMEGGKIAFPAAA